MKKIVGCVLCLAMLLCISACGYNPRDNTNSTNVNNNSSELSDKEKYDNAVAFFTEKKYQEAIGILENIDYENSKDLKKSISYVYACELFNKQEFSTAYENYKNSDDLLDSKTKMTEAAYYQGVKLVNNMQQGEAIDWFRKAMSNSQFELKSRKHIKTITTSLISSGWIGNYSNNGKSLQIEFKYFGNNENLYIGYADVSNGYNFISSLTGNFSIGAEESVFSPKELNESMEFEISFENNNKMFIYSSNETTYDLVGGSYNSEGASCLYEISDEKFPVIDIPQIDENGNLTNYNNTQIDNSNSTVSQDGNISKITAQNSKTKNSSNNTNTKPSNNTNSGSANNTNTSSKPTTTHTHSYSKATCTKPATCSCGATTGSTLGHTWKSASCKKPKTCSTCGATEGVKANHSYKNEKCTLCGEKSANYPKASDIKLEYPVNLKDNGVTFKILSYEINNMDEYFEGKAKIKITAEIIDGFYADTTAYFGIKYYDINGKDITKWKPYDTDFIRKVQNNNKYYYEIGDIGISEFEIPVNCRKIVLISEH